MMKISNMQNKTNTSERYIFTWFRVLLLGRREHLYLAGLLAGDLGGLTYTPPV